MLKCTACGTENPADFKFCENCGEKLAQIVCPICSHANLPDMKFCEECGQRLDVIKCSSCDHENPRDFKFCEECGHPLGSQVSHLPETEVSKPEDITPEIKPQPQRTALEPAAVSEKQPQRVLQPASAQPRKAPPRSEPKRTPEYRKQPDPKPAIQIPARVTKRPRYSAQPASEVAYIPRPKFKPKKPSYFKRVVVPMVTQAVVRFVVSSVIGFVAGKLGMFALKVILPYFATR